MKVGDKVYCIGDKKLYNIVSIVEYRSDMKVIFVKNINNDGRTQTYNLNYFMTLFITLKDCRKMKLNKLIDKL